MRLTFPNRARSVLVGAAAAIVIVTVSILPFLTAPWLAFEQGRAQVTAWTGYSEADVAAATNAIVSDLLFGPGDFDVEVAGEPVLTENERGHMRDVRGVFLGLWALTAVALVVLVVAAWRDRGAWWRAVTRGAATLAVVVVVVGAIAVVAFEPLWALFHRLFFSGGNYTFDPAEERLVQLFPFAFWQETAIVVGLVIVVLAAATAWVASGRGATPSPATAPTVNPEPAA